MNVFHSFDNHWHENFSSAVLALAFQASPQIGRNLLELIRRRAKGPGKAAAEAAAASYVVSREAAYEVRTETGWVKGRYDLLLTSGTRAIAIENKVEASLTRVQLRNQRLALKKQYPVFLLCALTKHDEPKLGEDVSLRWSDLVQLLPAPAGPGYRAVGQRLLADVRSYFGGLDMSFKGFGKQGVFETHRQRGFLLELLVGRLQRERGEPSWYDSRPKEGSYFYQCACFKDRYGGTGRYLGFYDYQVEDRTALELYRDDPSEDPIAALSWAEVRRTFPLGRRDHEPALAKLVKRFDASLKRIAPQRPSRKRR